MKKNLHAILCAERSFQLFQVDTKEHDCWIRGHRDAQFCKKLPTVPQVPVPLCPPTSMNELPPQLVQSALEDAVYSSDTSLQTSAVTSQ